MRSQSQLPDVVLEYLHDSPFFLPELHNFTSERRIKEKPTLKQILKSKQFRRIFYAILALNLFLYVRRKAAQADLWNRLTSPSCYFTKPYKPPLTYGSNQTDWSKFAYALYATDTEYLCNTVMLFDTLHHLGSKPDRLLMYPESFTMDFKANDKNMELLLKAKHDYGVKLVPIKIQHNNLAAWSGPNWSDSYTKLLAFNQTQYKRLVVLDSDSTIFEPMDELFFLPPARVAMPRAYWLPRPTMASHIMLLTPSTSSFSQVAAAIEDAGYGVYDMEIMNRLFGNDCIRLPHRPYALLTGEFRHHQHNQYMDDPTEEWNPDAAIMEAKFVHFSDHPLGKPWLVNRKSISRYAPLCGWAGREIDRDCRARFTWIDLYEEFQKRRKKVCEM